MKPDQLFACLTKTRSITITLFAALLMTSSPPATALDVVLPDPALNQCVEEHAASNNWLTAAEFIELRCPDRRIRDLSGLESFGNLQKLDMSDNKIRNISPISFMTQLTHLYLGGNSGIPADTTLNNLLANNQNLTHLDLSDIQIEDAANVPYSLALVELRLRNSGLRDVQAVSSMSSLQILDVSHNRIASLRGLGFISSLKQLDVSHNRIKSIYELDFIGGLTHLDLGGNAGIPLDFFLGNFIGNNKSLTHLGLADIAINDLANLPLYDQSLGQPYALEKLDVRNTGIADDDLWLLQDFSTLKSLNIADNGIVDINVLSQLTALQELDLRNNNITEISPMHSLSQISHLYLGGNAGIPNDSVLHQVLANNTGLTHLSLADIYLGSNVPSLFNPANGQYYDLIEYDLSNTGVNEVPSGFTSLKQLIMADNGLDNLFGVDVLINLESLNLSGNRLHYAGNLDILPHLERLDLSHNRITNIAGLQAFTRLTHLNLASNRGIPADQFFYDLVGNNPYLTHLNLSDIHIEDITTLPLYNPVTGKYYDLVELRLSNTGLRDISLVPSLSKLQVLDISHNLLTSLFWSNGTMPLRKLDASFNQLNNISDIQSLFELTHLDLSGNSNIPVDSQLHDLIKNNRQLTHLGLADIAIEYLSLLPLHDPDLGQPYALEELNLRNTRISDPDMWLLQDFATLRSLNIADNGINYIDGLAQLTGLQQLDLRDNRISDVTSLLNLNRLTHLYLGGNTGIANDPDLQQVLTNNTRLTHLDLSDIEIGPGLPKLYNQNTNQPYGLAELVLVNTGITDIPADFPTLKNLNLANNRLVYLFGLDLLQNLEELNLAGNRLNDISQLSLLSNLQRLDLSNNRISDISPLDSMFHLTHLNLGDNSDIVNDQVLRQVISNNISLTHLSLADIAIGDMNTIPWPFDPFTNTHPLVELDLSNTRLTQLAYNMTNFKNLVKINIAGNRLDSLWPLDMVVTLRHVDARNNRLNDVSAFRYHYGLTHLYFGGNPSIANDANLQDVLSNNTELTHLDLADIDLSSGLPDLSNRNTGQPYKLVELNLSRAGLSDAEIWDISSFATLEVLKLAGNNISDLFLVQVLQRLRELDLRDNAILDLWPLEFQTGLMKLYLGGNSGISDNVTLLQILNANIGLTHLDLSGILLGDLPPLQDPITNKTHELVELNLSNTGARNVPFSYPLLETLILTDNAMQNLSGIDQLKKLRHLNISNNAIIDVWPLQQLTNLRQLYLGGNAGIANDSALQQVLGNNYSLTHLGLANIPMTDTSLLYSDPVTGLPYVLVELDVSNTAITRVPTDYPGLKKLGIANNGLSSLNGVDQLQRLQELDLSSNQVWDLYPLEMLHDLTALNVSNNQVFDVSPLQPLEQLERLNLGGNAGITNDYILHNIMTYNPGLSHLNLADIAIGDLSQFPIPQDPLTNRSNLLELGLQNTGLYNLGSTFQFTNRLEKLNIADNQLEALLGIRDARRLRHIDARNNRLGYIDELVNLQFATYINLQGNRYIPCPDLDRVVQAFPPGVVIPPEACFTNQSPTIAISSPVAGTIYEIPDEILLSAVATDPEDGDISANINWVSNINGPLGTGGSLTVVLSAGAHTIQAIVEDFHFNQVIASIQIHVNAPPELTLLSPATGSVFNEGTPVTFNASATDAEDGDLGNMIYWSSDIDGLIGNGPTLVTILSPGNHNIIASVTDSRGASSSRLLELQVNAAPQVVITAPADGTVVNEGSTITLAASASDTEDGDLSAAILWTSSIDGVLGSGASLQTGLSAGVHDISAAVTDANGFEVSQTVSIRINALPSLSVTSPVNGTLINEDQLISFSVSATDAEDGDLSGTVYWMSDIDGFLDNGSSFSRTLSVGTHTITASVADYHGGSISQSLMVQVNGLPSVTITSPANGTLVNDGTVIGFAASASDSEDGDLSATISWQSNVDGPLGTGANISRTLSVGTHTITASVTDSNGASSTQVVAVTVNALPTVAINSPLSGAVINDGTTIGFAATASDSEDGDLSASISWQSSVDGALGTGANLNRALSVGMHTITASITDSAGAAATASVTIQVNALPQLTIHSPVNGARMMVQDGLTLSASASDTEDGDLASQVVWSSSLDGALGQGGTVAASLTVGVHQLTATVADSNGATASASVQVTIDEIPFTAARGQGWWVLLTWSNAQTAVDIYQDGVVIASGPATGSYSLKNKLASQYKVCETGTSYCSVTILVP